MGLGQTKIVNGSGWEVSRHRTHGWEWWAYGPTGLERGGFADSEAEGQEKAKAALAELDLDGWPR